MHILALQCRTKVLVWSLAPKEQLVISLKDHILPLLTDFLFSPLYLLKGNLNGREVFKGELGCNVAHEMSLKHQFDWISCRFHYQL